MLNLAFDINPVSLKCFDEDERILFTKKLLMKQLNLFICRLKTNHNTKSSAPFFLKLEPRRKSIIIRYRANFVQP